MFDDIIKDKINQHEAPVPPGTWDNIVKQKRKRRYPFFWWITTVLLLGGISTAVYLNSNYQKVVAGTDKKAARVITGEKNSSLEKSMVDDSELEKENSQINTKESYSIKEEKPKNTTSPVANVLKKNESTTDYKKDIAINTEKEIPDKSPSQLQTAKHKIAKKTRGRASYNSSGADAASIDETQELNSVSVITIEPPQNKPENKSVAVDNNQQQLAVNTVPVKKENKDNSNENKNNNTTPVNDKKDKSNIIKKSKRLPWFIELSAAPLLPIEQYNPLVSFNRTLFSNNQLTVFSGKLQTTSIEPSVAFQLSVKKELSTKLLLDMGLQYLQFKENISITGTETVTAFSIVNRLANGTNGPVLINDTLATVTEGTRNIKAVNSYQLFSIPVLLQYSLLNKHGWSMSAVSGLYVNISSSYQNEINRTAAALLTSTPVAAAQSSIGFDVFAGARLGKAFGKKFELFTLPSIRWNLGKYSIKNSLLNKTINQAGLSVGICYKMK